MLTLSSKPIPLINYQKYLSYIPSLWFTAICLGSTLQSIFFIATLFYVLGQGKLIENLKKIPLIFHIIIGLLVFWVLLTLIWTPQINHASIFQLKKIFYFALIPFIAQAFKNIHQQIRALNCFLIGMFITFETSLLKLLFKFPFNLHPAAKS